MCDQTVTLVHHVKGKDGDTYTCTTYSNASWFARQTISTSGDGAKPVNSYEVRIMTRDDISLDMGDYVVLGAFDNFEAPSDLDIGKVYTSADGRVFTAADGSLLVLDTAAHEHFRVTAIGDNRRGWLAHWRLSGQ